MRAHQLTSCEASHNYFLLFNSEYSQSAKMLVPGRPFQPSASFVGKVRSLPLDWSTFQGWDGVLAHATLAHAIMAHVIMAHCYKNDSVWRILLKWRVVIFSSQNVIMAH